MSERLSILVAGMMAGVPHQGGATWAVLQYLLGLSRLGHAVSFVEPVRQEDLLPAGASLGSSVNAQYLGEVARRFGLEGDSALLLAGSRQTAGLPYEALEERARAADLLLDISGLLRDEPLFGLVRRRVYLDLDPAFTQLWQTQGVDMKLAGHTHFVSIGERLGRPGCAVPDCGVSWLTTKQPLILEEWPVVGAVETDAFTTVANWRAYGSIEHEGVFYGQKVHSLRQFMALPRLSKERFALALSIHPDESRDLEALAANGWRLLCPSEVAGDPDSYRRFIQGSKAELAIAKSGYALAKPGWFSDRSICYLASGRPVIAQDTGLEGTLPLGTGLLAFDSMDTLLGAVHEVNRNYATHRRAARAIAEEYFDSAKVLPRLLDAIGGSPCQAS